MPWHKIIYAYLILILFILNCGGGGSSESPVAVIENNSPVLTNNIKIEPVNRIGNDESKGENYYFGLPVNVVKTSDTKIHILDMMNSCVKTFDSNFNHIKTFGRKGQGPGEFLFSLGMDTDEDNNIYISDPNNSRIQVFKYGNFVRTIRIEKPVAFFSLFTQSSMIVNSRDKDHILKILDDSGRIIKSFCRKKKYSNSYIENKMNDVVFDIDSEYNIYVAFTHLNIIEKYSKDLKLLYVIKRPLDYKVKYDLTMKTIPKTDINIETVETTFVTNSAALDDKDRLWVLSYSKQPETWQDKDDVPEYSDFYRFDIFDQSGKLISRIDDRLPVFSRIPCLRIFGSRLFLIDAEVKAVVYEYRIFG